MYTTKLLNTFLLAGLVIVLTIGGCALPPLEDADITKEPSLEDILNQVPISQSTYFKTMQDVFIKVTVKDAAGQAVPMTLVTVKEDATGDEIFKGLTDDAGVIEGLMTVSLAYGDLSIEAFNQDNDRAVKTITVNVGQTAVNVDLTLAEVTVQSQNNYNWGLDSDGDNVPDFCDNYPQDPDMAFKIPYPCHLVAYEDLFPQDVNDWDVNDLVVKVQMYRGVDKNHKMKELGGRLALKARGAAAYYTPSDFFLRMILDQAQSEVSYTVTETKPNGVVRTFSDTLSNSDEITMLMFQDTLNGFDCAPTSFINTKAPNQYCDGATSEFLITFSKSFYFLNGIYDPYLLVNNPNTGTVNDIHLPFTPPIAGSDNPVQNDFIDDNGFPYAIILPSCWRWPLERVSIADAYPDFDDWVLSEYGKKDPSTLLWFTNPDYNKVYIPSTF